jgi:hypothetical protein
MQELPVTWERALAVWRYREFRLVLVAAEPRADLWDVVGEVTKEAGQRGH